MDSLIEKIKKELKKLENIDPKNNLCSYGRIENNHFIPQYAALEYDYWMCSSPVNKEQVLNFYLTDLKKENIKYLNN